MEQIAADVCARAITLRTRVSSESASKQAGTARARLEAMIVVASMDDAARHACFPNVMGVLPRNGQVAWWCGGCPGRDGHLACAVK